MDGQVGIELLHGVAHTLQFQGGVACGQGAIDVQSPEIGGAHIAHVAQFSADVQVGAQPAAHLFQGVHLCEAEQIGQRDVAAEVGLHRGVRKPVALPVPAQGAAAASGGEVLHHEFLRNAAWRKVQREFPEDIAHRGSAALFLQSAFGDLGAQGKRWAAHRTAVVHGQVHLTLHGIACEAVLHAIGEQVHRIGQFQTQAIRPQVNGRSAGILGNCQGHLQGYSATIELAFRDAEESIGGAEFHVQLQVGLSISEDGGSPVHPG